MSYPGKRVLQFTEATAPGGVLGALEIAVPGLKEKGWDVHVAGISRRQSNDWRERLNHLGVPLHSLNEDPPASFLDYVRIARRLRELVSYLQPSVVHIHSAKAGLVGRLALATCVNRNVLYTPHCYAFCRKDISKLTRVGIWTCELLLARLTDHVVACSRTEYRLSRVLKGRRHVSLVENAVAPVDDITNEPPVTTGKSVNVVAVGRLCAQKNPSAFAELASRFTHSRQFRFYWVGDGEPTYRHELLGKGVKVTGWLTEREVSQRLATAHVYVHCALWEAMPLSLMKAQYLGLPCIALPSAGARDLIENGFTGYVSKDIDSLAKVLVSVLADPARLNWLRRNTKSVAQQRYSVDRYNEELSSVYNLALSVSR